MGFSLRTITDVSRFSENVRLNVLERAVPQATEVGYFDNPDAMTVLVPFPLARTVQRG